VTVERRSGSLEKNTALDADDLMRPDRADLHLGREHVFEAGYVEAD
jgi:hypothetical protein